MSYQGDIAEDQAFSFHFTTRKDTGLPTTLSGTPVLSVYKDNNLTQTTTGPTLTVDADSVTGYNRVDMVTTDAFYVAASDYTIVITTGTVNSISVIGEVVGTFSVNNRGLLRLTSTAETNLEYQYDGSTGLTGDIFPGTQAQLSNIANVGSAINKPASSYTLTTGTQSANTYAATEALDGTRHEHTDGAGAMELYYEFLIGAGTPSSVQITGYIFSANDDVDVYGYDWAATAWVQIGNLPGSSASNNVNSYDMFVNMVGAGSDAGKVRVRLYKASGLTSATLAIDQIFVAFSQEAVSALDAVYFDSGASNTGTTSIDGVPGNPVSSEAAVNTLLAARNLYRVVVALESSVIFATSHIDEIWEGPHWILANGGQNLSGSHFGGADVTGTATASVDPIDYNHCEIGTSTLPQFHMRHCDFNGTVTFGEAGDYLISGSHSGIAGATTPIFDTGAAVANVNFSISDWQNGLEIRNLNNSGTDNFSISGVGQIIYAASCSGTVNQRGDWKVTNTGGVTITEDDNTANVAAILVDTGTTLPATLGTPAADMSADIAAIKVDTAATLTDTNELQGDWTDGGRLDLLLDALITEINTATGEPGQEAPGVSIKRGKKIDYLYKAFRNRGIQTSTQQSLYADDGTTVDHKATISDDGTTFVKGEFGTGA